MVESDIASGTYQVPIVPAQGNRESWIDETASQLGECAGCWVQCSHLSEALHDEEYVKADHSERYERANLVHFMVGQMRLTICCRSGV